MLRTVTYLTPRMREQELTHRRLVLCGIGALLLLSLSPVVGHHVTTSLDAALMGRDHLLDVCVIALHTLLAPVHGLFHVLLIAGVMYATFDRLRAVLRLRRILSVIASGSGTTSLLFDDAVRASGLSANRVRVVDGLPNPAFTAGWWTPRVYVSREIENALSPQELIAVLVHEAEHVRRRDPLRLSLLRFVGCMLFWIPAFRRLAADMADEAEIAADDVAARDQPLVLASAILALAAWRVPQGILSGAGAFSSDVAVTFVANGLQRSAAHDDLLDRRIRRLAGETTVVRSHLTRRSVLSAALVLCAVWISGVIVSHPLPAQGVHAHPEHPAHCEHPGEGALSHLFCRNGLLARASGVALTGGSADGIETACPHAHNAA
ncbi:MAG: M56 family metallopeptidase [Phycisphaerae bacterium]|nr:M56 family metallopeptidase [Gemmatimonadaceae bacterium]